MKNRQILILLLVAFLLPFQFCFAQLDPNVAPVINAFSKQLSTDLNNEGLHAGISVAVIKGNQVIWLSAYGYANTGDNTPADTNTIYRIGSITKTFTATLLMQLVQEGKIKLDDPVENYLPEIKNLTATSMPERLHSGNWLHTHRALSGNLK